MIQVLATDGVASQTRMSLPETYAALMRDEVGSFPALRPHQRHAWHAFTVQLGAMALHRAGTCQNRRPTARRGAKSYAG